MVTEAIALHRMKKACILLLFLASDVLALGQWAADQPRRFEEKAASVIEEALDSIQSHKSLHMRFNYSMIDGQGEAEEEMEAILITEGEKYFMQLGDHYFISDGEVVWVFFSDVNEVHISRADDVEDSLSPTAIMKGFAGNFRSKWIREELVRGRPAHIIDMLPQEAQSFFKYRVAICTESIQLAYIKAYDRQGKVLRYEVSSYLPNEPTDPKLFGFAPEDHPGIEVVDLR